MRHDVRILDAETHDRVFAAVGICRICWPMRWSMNLPVARMPINCLIMLRRASVISPALPRATRKCGAIFRSSYALLAKLDRYGAALMRIRQALVNKRWRRCFYLCRRAGWRSELVSLLNHFAFHRSGHSVGGRYRAFAGFKACLIAFCCWRHWRKVKPKSVIC